MLRPVWRVYASSKTSSTPIPIILNAVVPSRKSLDHYASDLRGCSSSQFFCILELSHFESHINQLALALGREYLNDNVSSMLACRSITENGDEIISLLNLKGLVGNVALFRASLYQLTGNSKWHEFSLRTHPVGIFHIQQSSIHTAVYFNSTDIAVQVRANRRLDRQREISRASFE